MSVSLKQYTMRYLVVTILAIITIWASLFYAFILDEVYDNVDDGLRNQKILILRAVYEDPSILEIRDFGISQFKVSPAKEADFSERNMFSNEMYYMPYDDEDEPYRVLRTGFYGPDKLPYHLEIRTSTVERDDLILDLSIALGVLYLVMIASIFLLNQYVLTRAWKPFRSILRNLDQYHVGRTKRIEALQTNVKEFKELHQRVDEMIQRNEAVFAEQKLFIENASHELQTPLAITINKIDVMMESEHLSENMVVQLADTKNALQRLISLNKSLLMLSRIENKQFVQNECVDLNAITKELVENLEDLALHKGLKWNVRERERCIVKGNHDLLLMALSNLIRNAIRYTESGGEIYIDIDKDLWQIKNTSLHGALAASYIFNRFYKGSESIQSNGLGLSIVHSIIGMTPDASIKYFFENNFHIFSVSFSNS